MTVGVSAIAAITSSVKAAGCGEVKRTRSMPSTPPNPTELMARTVLEDAIEKLKERYDYIILDTAPIAIVTDTAIASRVADMCVYVCRADVTPKLGYQYINVLRDQKKFDKLATVINSIDLNSRKSSYGYKYGYGYGHKYGYGYVAETCGKKD